MINGINSSNAGINSISSSGVRVQSDNKGSESSNNVQKAEQVSRVQEIKRQIELGEYHVNIDKTAQKVAEALIG